MRNCNPTRSITDVRSLPQPKQAINTETAEAICLVHLNTYQPKLRRSFSQRSAYYNATIQRLLNDCIFDVGITGEAAVRYIYPYFSLYHVSYLFIGCVKKF